MAGETRDRTVEVRVGIVSFNTAALLDRCLAALPAALDGLVAEVVVIDNDSHDESIAVAERHEGVDVCRNPVNAGYARAMNDALTGSDAPVLIALNPDTEPLPGSLRALVDRLHAHPRTGLVVPRLLNADGTLQPSVHRFPSVSLAAVANLVPARGLRGALGRRYWIEGAVDHRSCEPIDWAYGAVHVLRRDAAGVRPYDERSFMYAEDLDLCWRLQREGWTVELAGDIAVPHIGNAAGSKHWGAERETRVWTATYDWCARALGPSRTRVYAALNAGGALTRGLAQQVRGRVRRDPAARARGRQLRAMARIHARGMTRPRSS